MCRGTCRGRDGNEEGSEGKTKGKGKGHRPQTQQPPDMFPLYSPNFAFNSRSSLVRFATCSSSRCTRTESGAPEAAGSSSGEAATGSTYAPPRRCIQRVSFW